MNQLSELNKRVNMEADAHRCSLAVLESQKQKVAGVIDLSF